MTIKTGFPGWLLGLILLGPPASGADAPHVVARPIDAAGSLRKAAVAAHPGTRAALHAWQAIDVGAGAPSPEIFATLVPTHPVPSAPTTIRRISYMGSGGSAHDVAATALGDRFLVAWSGRPPGAGSPTRIYLAGLSLAGVVTAPQLLVSTAALAPDGQPANDSRPQVACSATHASCLVVWTRRRGAFPEYTEVHGRHFDLLAGTLGPEFQISRAGSAQVPTGRATRPRVVFSPARVSYVVAWTGYAGEAEGDGYAYLAEVAPRSHLPGPPRSIPMPLHHGRVTPELAIAASIATPHLFLAIGFLGQGTGYGLLAARLRFHADLPVLDGHDLAVAGPSLIHGPRLALLANDAMLVTWGEGASVTQVVRHRAWLSRRPDEVRTIVAADQLDPDLHFVHGPATSLIQGERVWLAWSAEVASPDGPRSRILGRVFDPDRLLGSGFQRLLED